MTGRLVEAFANAVARATEAAERERCFQIVQAILAQVEDLDDIDPQPDMSCIDWLRTALAKIVGPNLTVIPFDEWVAGWIGAPPPWAALSSSTESGSLFGSTPRQEVGEPRCYEA